MNKNRGFSLIELLVVLAIISILSGFLFSVGKAARGRARQMEAQAMISALETAISMYRADTGSYPAEDAGGPATCATLVTVLTSGAYIEFNAADLSGGSVIDPWGTAYRYDVSPASGNTASYNLWSCGPNGTSGNADDITNW